MKYLTKTQLSVSLLFLVFLMACNTAKEKKQDKANVEPVIESNLWNTYKGNDTNAPKIVLISGDEEYRSEEGLTQLGKILSKRHGFNCTVHYSQDLNNPGIIDANYHGNIPGLEALKEADLMIILTRFRALSDDQMQLIDDYLMAGKPVIGLRTSTHAFQFNTKDSIPPKWMHYSNSFNDENSEWNGGFGRLILGEKWISHHGHHKHQSTLGIIDAKAKEHPISNGITDGDIWGPTDVYGVRLPLPGDSQPIILGQVMNRIGAFDDQDPFYGMKPTDSEIALINPQQKTIKNINDPMMPIAWTKSYQLPGGKNGKSFTSTIASSTDLMSEGVRRLIINASYWTMGLEVPKKADVTLVGAYHPTAYGFKKGDYWQKLGKKVVDIK